MATDEPDGFLAKVARLVRRPASAWPDSDGGPSAGGLSDKQALKEAIERKKRNDFVRKREFDMLRAIRRREQGARDREARPSFFQSSHPAKGDGREMTKRKIDEIEAQMSTHWWQHKPGEERAPERLQAPAARPGGESPVPAHLQAQAFDTTSEWSGTVQGAPLPTQPAEEAQWPVISRPLKHRAGSVGGPTSLPVTFGDDLSSLGESQAPRTTLDTTTPTGWAGLAREICHAVPALEAAAVHFINHDLVQTERLLKDAVSQAGAGDNRQLARSVLLDFYRLTGRQADFEASRAAWEAESGSPPGITWGPLTEPAPVAVSEGDWPPAWVCPSQLDSRAVAALKAHLASPAAAHALDWSALSATNPETASQLLEVLEACAETPGLLCWAGHQHLRRRLQASTPSGRRENHAVWWKLRLAVLRLLGHQDEFDLTALDYCVTYGVTPPDWAVPRSTNELHDRWPPDGDVPTQAMALPLSGQLRGDPSAVLATLEAQAGAGELLRIDCAGLQHVDLVAAGALLQWGKALQGRGRRAVLERLHRLLALSLHVVGVDETLQLRVRTD